MLIGHLWKDGFFFSWKRLLKARVRLINPFLYKNWFLHCTPNDRKVQNHEAQEAP